MYKMGEKMKSSNNYRPNRATFIQLLIQIISLAWVCYGKYELEEIYMTPGPDNQPTMIFTEPFLARFDGTNPNEPIYVSVRGVVFDVTSQLDEYNPGKTLSYMAGKDVSRALAKNSTEEEDYNDNLDGLTDEELENLDRIYKEYKRNFHTVGYMSYIALKEKINTEMDADEIKRARIRTKNNTASEDKTNKKKKKKKGKGKKKKKDATKNKAGEGKTTLAPPLYTTTDTTLPITTTTTSDDNAGFEKNRASTMASEPSQESRFADLSNKVEPEDYQVTTEESLKTTTRQVKVKADDLLSKKETQGGKKVLYDVKDTSTLSAKDYYVPYAEKPENDYYHDKFAAEYEERKKSEL